MTDPLMQIPVLLFVGMIVSFIAVLGVISVEDALSR